MPHAARPLIGALICAALVASSPGVARAAVASRGPASLLSPGTVAALVVDDAPRALSGWKRTSAHSLLADDALGPLRADLDKALAKGQVFYPWLLGLTPDEVEALAGGAVGIALTAEAGGGPAFALVVELGSKAKDAPAILAKARARLGRSAKGEGDGKGEGGAALTRWPLPPNLARGRMSEVVDAVRGGMLVSATDAGVAQAILGRMAGSGAGLASSEVWSASARRAAREVPQADALFYMEPLAAWGALREVLGADAPAGVDLLAVLRAEGFGAVQGVGGALTLGRSDVEWLLQGYGVAPGPFQRGAALADVKNAPLPAPPGWIPRAVSAFGALSVDFKRAFEASSTLFDALFGGGQPGVFEDVLMGLRDAPDGPQVDIRGGIVPALKGPLYVMRGPDPAKGGQALTAAIPVEGEAAVAEAVARLAKDNPSKERLPLGAHGLWRLPQPPADPLKGGMPRPGAAAVSEGSLILGQSADAALALFKAEGSLASDPAYKKVMEILGRFAGQSLCGRLFLRPGDGISAGVDAMRGGGIKQLRSPLVRALRALMIAERRVTSPVDLASLPSAEVIRRHLSSPAGVAISRVDGGFKVVALMPR